MPRRRSRRRSKRKIKRTCKRSAGPGRGGTCSKGFVRRKSLKGRVCCVRQLRRKSRRTRRRRRLY